MLCSLSMYGQTHVPALARPTCIVDVPIGVQPGAQSAPAVTSDGRGGFIVAWQDTRNNIANIYVQRIDSTGTPVWPAGGVRASLDTTIQLTPRIVSDNAGGAIIEWQDDDVVPVLIYPGVPGLAEYTRSFSTQRLDQCGNRLWGDNGVIIRMVHKTYDPYALNMNSERLTGIAPDGRGGAFYLSLVYTWASSNSSDDMVMGRVSPAGMVLWSDVAITYSPASLGLSLGQIAADGVGGAIVSWTYPADAYNLALNYDKLGVARVDGTGNKVWSSNPLSDDTQQSVFSYGMTPDDSGGVYLCWDGAGSYPAPLTADRNLSAQRVDINGVRRWGPNGVIVSNAQGVQASPTIATIPGGGAIVAWQDYRNNPMRADIDAGRIGPDGTLQWPGNGSLVCHADSTPVIRGVVCDRNGGSTVVWDDFRSSAPGIYAQSLNTAGKVRWQANGSPVAVGVPGQSRTVVAGNTAARAFVVWQDTRNPDDLDVYGQWADVNAVLQSGSLAVAVRNAIGYGDPGANVRVSLYDPNRSLAETRSTGSDGVACFPSVIADTGYSLRVEYAPSDPERIYGKEYWGTVNGVGISVAETTAVVFQRNTPYTSRITVSDAATNLPVTGGVPFGTPIRVSIEITNPDVPGSATRSVRCMLALDRDSHSEYDFLDTSSAQLLAIGAVRSFDFTLVPPDSGSYFHAAGARIDENGLGIQTEGGRWGSIPDFVVDPPPPGGVLVTVRTEPAGRTFVADDSTYADTRAFVWIAGSSHTIGVPSLQSPHSGMQYRWTQWSDGDSASHAITTPSSRTTYTALFDTMYYLTMISSNGGTVAPLSGWYKSGSVVSLHEQCTPGWRFLRWTGAGLNSYSGNDSIHTIIVDSVMTESAVFEPTTGMPGLLQDVPSTYSLVGNYPNPFNPTTMIRFGIPTRSRVRLVVYTLLGQEVAELINGEVEAGYHDARFDSNNLSSGTYIYRLTTDKYVQTKKLIVLK